MGGWAAELATRDANFDRPLINPDIGDVVVTRLESITPSLQRDPDMVLLALIARHDDAMIWGGSTALNEHDSVDGTVSRSFIASGVSGTVGIASSGANHFLQSKNKRQRVVRSGLPWRARPARRIQATMTFGRDTWELGRIQGPIFGLRISSERNPCELVRAASALLSKELSA
jgi:hypothetical protein